MLELANDVVGMSVSEDGLDACIVDLRRGCRWSVAAAGRLLRYGEGDIHPLAAGSARVEGDATIACVHRIDGGQVMFRWRLCDDHVALSLEVDVAESAGLTGVSLPGCLQPGEPAGAELLVPIYQGALLRHTDRPFERATGRGGHAKATLGMLGFMQRGGALLATPDELVDWSFVYGDGVDGVYGWFWAHRCAVTGWRGATMRLCPCGPAVEEVAARYRKWALARGQWKGWEEKIAAKPSLERLFGGLLAFVGYIKDDDTDYVAGARALRDMGFESVYYFPTRFAHYSQEFKMGGGYPPIWLDDATQDAMRAVEGACIAPWAWTVEGPDDGSERMHDIFRHHSDGSFLGGWAMDRQKWYYVCTPYQIEFIKRMLAGDMASMGWLHFDVNATFLPSPCFRTDHALHGNAPLPSYREVDEVRRLLSVDTVGDRVVSSEGFSDMYTSAYDIGTTMMIPRQEAPEQLRAVPVPLTMLVYHDCTMQTWWEMHSYNMNPCWTPERFFTGDCPLGLGCSGLPELKASIDALYGLAPNVFPFGGQYGWKVAPGGDTYKFRIGLGDPEVQRALRAALPVTRLHKRVGKLQMTGFRFLSGDRLVQRTEFADGTSVVANIGGAEADVEGVGKMAAHSWRAE